MPIGPRGLERNHPQALTSELAAPVDANTPNLLPDSSTLNAYKNVHINGLENNKNERYNTYCTRTEAAGTDPDMLWYNWLHAGGA